MTTVVFDLLPLNGLYEAGIAAGTEDPIIASRYLPIHFAGLDIKTIIRYVVRRTHTIAVGMDLVDSSLNTLMVNAVVAIINFNLLGNINGVPDSSVCSDDNPSESTTEQHSLVTRENIRIALTYIISTKISFWSIYASFRK